MVKKILTLPPSLPFNNQKRRKYEFWIGKTHHQKFLMFLLMKYSDRFSSNVVCCKNYCSNVYIMYSIICFSSLDYKCILHWQKYAKITPNGVTLATYIQSAFSETEFSTLITKLGKNNASGENQVSSFYKCSIYPFTPTPVLETLPSKIITSTQKILDASLPQQLQQIRKSPICDMPLAEKKELI